MSRVTRIEKRRLDATQGKHYKPSTAAEDADFDKPRLSIEA
jgi:hypothetical protein